MTAGLPGHEPLSDPAAIARLILAYQAAGMGFRVPLLRRVREGTLALLEVPRGASPSLRPLNRTGRPAVVLIGDDDAQPTGPAGWPTARKIAAWARAAMVHASGGEPAHYEAAARSAMTAGRFVLIETASHMAPCWCQFLRSANPSLPVLLLLPPAGAQHPAPGGETRH